MKFLKLAAVFAVFFAGAAPAQMVENGITVTGEGRVSAPPDMATITLGVTQNATTAKEVVAQVNMAVGDILAQLQKMGVAQKDLQTSGFYLQPQYNQSAKDDAAPRAITGYQAGNSVTLRVRDLDRLGALMDAVLEFGGNDFNGLSFGLQDDAAAKEQARAQAVADAQARASQLAQAAGIKLGNVQRMTEHGGHIGGHMQGFAAARSTMSEAIVGGEVDVVVQVTMLYAIAYDGD